MDANVLTKEWFKNGSSLMKYLILGCSSFAGQACYAHLAKNKYDVVGITRSSQSDEYMWPWMKDERLKKHWLQYNIYSQLEELIECVTRLKPNIVIDFMGQGMVAQSWDDPALWIQTNSANKSKLLAAMCKLDSIDRYIRASTPEVYGASDSYRNEYEQFNPSTPYAISHAAIDYYVRCIGTQYGFPYFIARYANFYGIGQQLYRLVPRLFLSCYTKCKFILDGGGKSRRSFIYSTDIVDSIDLMIKNGNPMNEYHFSGLEEVEITKIVDIVCEITDAKRAEFVESGPERTGKDACYRLNCYKSIKELKWEPKIQLTQGLRQTSEWIKGNLSALSNRSWNYTHRQ